MGRDARSGACCGPSGLFILADVVSLMGARTKNRPGDILHPAAKPDPRRILSSPINARIGSAFVSLLGHLNPAGDRRVSIEAARSMREPELMLVVSGGVIYYSGADIAMVFARPYFSRRSSASQSYSNLIESRSIVWLFSAFDAPCAGTTNGSSRRREFRKAGYSFAPRGSAGGGYLGPLASFEVTPNCNDPLQAFHYLIVRAVRDRSDWN
jgi:hypothetical protein